MIPIFLLNSNNTQEKYCKLNNISLNINFFQRQADPGQFRQAVEWGIEAGYRHIDTASFYGNEVEVGEGINNKIKEGLVTRDQLFVTTKARTYYG